MLGKNIALTLIKNISNGIEVYGNKRAIILLLLGFSAGLPFTLVFATLSFWLGEAKISVSLIGYLSWITVIYGFKWAWSPLVDNLKIPLLSNKLGHRRSWMLLAQVILMISIIGMGISDPLSNIWQLVLFAILVAFSSATQDIIVDAFRIDSAPIEMQASLSAMYQLGYRIAMILATAGALKIAAIIAPDKINYNLYAWQKTYFIMGSLMLVGIFATLWSSEPKVDTKEADLDIQRYQLHLETKFASKIPNPALKTIAWLSSATIVPIQNFFHRFGKVAFLIILFISTYRIADIVLGVMANPFYIAMGFTKDEIAFISKIFGVIMTLCGALFGGILIPKFGMFKILFIGGLLVATTNLLFAYQAVVGHNTSILTIVISLDNFSSGIATVAFLAYLSSLTATGYTASQYALLSSIMMLFPKFIGGFSGDYVMHYGYQNFFIMTSIIGAPSLVIIYFLYKIQKN